MNQEIEEIETTNDEVTCTACLTIPVSHLSLEEGVSVPIGGWPSLFEEQGIRVVTDTAGKAGDFHAGGSQAVRRAQTSG